MLSRFFKVLAENRKARFDYQFVETFQAGIAPRGTEVKSIRSGQVNLRESFARFERGELVLYGMHVSPYKFGRGDEQVPTRPRKLLLKKNEIRKLVGRVQEKGLTLIPIKLYLSGNWVKVDLGLGKAKKIHEKREVLKQKAENREVQRVLRDRSVKEK